MYINMYVCIYIYTCIYIMLCLNEQCSKPQLGDDWFGIYQPIFTGISHSIARIPINQPVEIRDTRVFWNITHMRWLESHQSYSHNYNHAIM